MNKFSKTSYSRHFNQQSFLNSIHQTQSKKLNNEQTDTFKNKVRFHDFDNSKPLQSLIEKKIQIDPSLLLTGKPNQFQGRTTKGEKNTLEKKEFSSTFNDCLIKNVRQRPESKKESRIKVINNLSLNKGKEDTMQRPQTSKGQRNVVYNRQTCKTLNNQDEHEQQVKREIKTSYGSLRRNTAKQLELQTSIDPEFLSLFSS